MAIKKVPVVAPFDLGRGIKRIDDIAKFEVDLNDYVDNSTVVYENGKLSIVSPCAKAKDLNRLDVFEGKLKKLGITCFYGKVKAGDASTTKGAPVQLGKTDVESSKAIRIETQVPEGVDLDFNGWQIATDAEVTQYLYTSTTDGKQSGWTRSNEAGVNPDGTLKDLSAWSDWMYELNLPSKPILVSTAGAIEGDGSTTNPIKLEFNDTIVKNPDGKYGADIKVKAAKEADGKVVITNQDGSTVEIEKSVPATAGLDCAAIDALPERPWKKGTVLLAKQDGECVRLTSLDSIFQEIGVGITADQTNSFTGEKYKVVVTVTNTGEGKNELTNLNIVGPANVEDYDIQDVSFTKSEADEVEQVNDLTYNIRGLKKGGTVKVKYTVVPKAKGTFQFTAAVNPNSPLDKDLGNNNATVILYADTKVKAITGENCPAITLKDVDTSEVLTQASTVGGDKFNTNPWVGTNPTYIETVQYINIYANRTTLQGLVLEADADITVVANHQKSSEAAAGVGTVDGSIFGAYPAAVGTNPYGNTFISPTTVHEVTTDSVNVSGRRLTVTADANALVLAVRPRGANCYWQVYVILAKSDPQVEKITVTNVTGGVLSNSRVPKGVNTVGDKQFNVVPGTLTTMRKISVGYVEKQIVTVKKGTAATATLDFGKLTKFYSSGLVEITANSLTVSANATPSDSIRSTYLDVIIEE